MKLCVKKDKRMSELELKQSVLRKEVQIKTHGRITVITSDHATEEQFLDGGKMWPLEVNDIISRLRPSPRLFVIDSISAISNKNRIPRIGQMVPLNLMDFPADGKSIYVLAGDVTGIFDRPELMDTPKKLEVWQATKNAIIEWSPGFDPESAGSVDINHALNRAYSIEEGVVAAGLTVLTGRILLRVIDNRQAKNVSPEGERASRKFSRREFLKMGAGAVAAVAGFIRRPILRETWSYVDVAENNHTLLQMITQVTKPILLELLDSLHQGNMRNAKIGLTAMEGLDPSHLPGASAVIIMGTAHRFYEFPGQQTEEETLLQAQARLMGVMRRGLEGIVRNIRTGDRDNVIPDDILTTTLTEIFATYDFYRIPQRQRVTPGIHWIKKETYFIPKVVELIQKVVNDTEELCQ